MLDYGSLITGLCQPIWRIDVGTSASDGRKMPTGTHGAPGVLERNCAIASPSTPFDPRRPWASVWIDVVDDTDYWQRQFEEQALLTTTQDASVTLSLEKHPPRRQTQAHLLSTWQRT